MSVSNQGSTSYGAALGRGLSAALIAATTLGLGTNLGIFNQGGGRALLVVVALFLAMGLLFGVVTGIILGALHKTFGASPILRAVQRIQRDKKVDHAVCAAIITFALTAIPFIAIVAIGGQLLIAKVQRQEVGAILLGVVLTAVVPILFLASLALFRGARVVSWVIPRIGPLTKTWLLLVGITTAGTGALIIYITNHLDTHNLSLAFAVDALLFVAIAITWMIVSSTLLKSKLSQIPGIRLAPWLALTLAITVIFTVLPGPLDERGNTAIDQDPGLSRLLLVAARSLVDRDGDGYSPLLGGPDCDDANKTVNPDPQTVDIPGNLIDENCFGGDAKPPQPAQDNQPDLPKPTSTPEPVRSKKSNLLFLVIDTLRADRLGIANYKRDQRGLTPHLDKFAQRSAYFRRAYAQAPNTPRSFPSLFTSQLPSQVRVDKSFKNYSVVLPDNLSIWEALTQAGYLTLGYSSHFYFTKKRGIRQGFAEYHNDGAKSIADSNKDIAAPRIVPKVIARMHQLAAAKHPFALFVHLFEPHSTYMAHPGHPITERGVSALVQKYDYEILFVDEWIGKILKALAQTGLEESTVVVILSDHGEAFGVHRFHGKKLFFHGQTLYDELLRVPLLIHVPGQKPVVVDPPVSLVDVMPTVLDTLGLDLPKTFGRSLLPAIAGHELPPKPVYSELIAAPSWNYAAKMVVSSDGRHKLIYSITSRRYEFYDLQEDPQEQRNLFAQNPTAAEPLRKILQSWLEIGLP